MSGPDLLAIGIAHQKSINQDIVSVYPVNIMKPVKNNGELL